MPLIYQRTETKSEITIVYKYYPAFYFVVLPMILMANFTSGYANYFSIAGFVAAGYFVIELWKPNLEITRAMRNGKVVIHGSKFSFSNPFTAIIQKK